MKKTILISVLFLISFSVFSQEKKDSLFQNQEKKCKSNLGISLSIISSRQLSTYNYILANPYETLYDYSTRYGSITPELAVYCKMQWKYGIFKNSIMYKRISTFESYKVAFSGSPSWPYPSTNVIKSMIYKYDMGAICSGFGLKYKKMSFIPSIQLGYVLFTRFDYVGYNGGINHDEESHGNINLNKKVFSGLSLEFNYNISKKIEINAKAYRQFKIYDIETGIDNLIYGFQVSFLWNFKNAKS